MAAKSRITYHIIIFSLTIAILLSIFILDSQANELKKKFGCAPASLVINKETISAKCKEFLSIEPIVETLFIILAGSIASLIVVNQSKRLNNKLSILLLWEEKASYNNIQKLEAPVSYPGNESIFTRISRIYKRKTFLSDFTAYTILLVIGILFWSPNIFLQNFFLWNDATVYLNLEREFNTNFYAWHDSNLGSPSFISSHLQLVVFLTILNHIGFSLLSLNHLFMLLSVVVSGWTMYYTLSRFITTHKKLSAFSGAVFYMLAPVVVTYGLGTTFAMAYSLFPLFFYLAYRGLREKGAEVTRASALGMTALGIATSPQIFGLVIIAGTLLVFAILAAKRRINVKFLVLSLSITFVLNSFWIIPLAINANETFSFFSPEVQGRSAGEISKNTDILLSTRLLHWSFFGSKDLGSLGYILWLIPAYCFAAVLLQRRKIVYFMAALATFSLLFSTGTKYPFLDSIYGGVTSAIPYLFISLQNIHDYLFLTSFAYAILFAFTTQSIARYYMKIKHLITAPKERVVRILLVFFVTFILASNSFLALIGDSKVNTLNHKIGAEIPADYLELADVISLHDLRQGYRMLVLPWQQWYIEYGWYRVADMVDLSHRISPLPTLGYVVSTSSQPAIELRNDMVKGDSARTLALKDSLSDLNIKYILVHKDFRNTTSLTGYTGAYESYREARAALVSKTLIGTEGTVLIGSSNGNDMLTLNSVEITDINGNTTTLHHNGLSTTLTDGGKGLEAWAGTDVKILLDDTRINMDQYTFPTAKILFADREKINDITIYFNAIVTDLNPKSPTYLQQYLVPKAVSMGKFQSSDGLYYYNENLAISNPIQVDILAETISREYANVDFDIFRRYAGGKISGSQMFLVPSQSQHIDVYSYDYNKRVAELLGGKRVIDTPHFTLYELFDIDGSVSAKTTPLAADTQVEFRKVNPVFYTGSVKGNVPFTIVLGQQFNPNWTISLNGTKLVPDRHSDSILSSLTAWSKEGTGKEVQPSSETSNTIVASSKLPSSKGPGENFYSMKAALTNFNDFSNYDTISLDLKITEEASGKSSEEKLTKYVTLYDSFGKSTELLLPKNTEYGKETIINIPLDGQPIRNKSFNLDKITAVAFNVVNNLDTPRDLHIEIYDVSLIRSTHFISNGYANAWRVENPGFYQFDIEYQPQWIVLFSVTISAIAVVITSAILGTQLSRKLLQRK